MFLLSAVGGALGIGGSGAAAAGGAAATAGTTAATAAGSGFSLASILEGTATVLGLVSAVSAGAAEKEAADLAAEDAKREQPLENLQGIDRRRSLKVAAAEAIGEMDVAYAGSGVDLSFGTAAQARREALRETDLGLTSDAGTQMTRVSRLQERAANFRRIGKRALMSGVLSGVSGAMSSFARMRERY